MTRAENSRVATALHAERTLINAQADRVRDVAGLATAKGRRKHGMFLVEGPQAVREAIGAHGRAPLLDAVYTTEQFLDRHEEFVELLEQVHGTRAGGASSEKRKVFLRLASPEVLEAMSDALTPQGILATASTEAALSLDPWAGGLHPPLVAAMVRVQDPGNAGTLVRAADAAGARGVVSTVGSVDLTNPKTVRSTTGSMFHLPVSQGAELTDLVAKARKIGMLVLAADGYGAEDLDQLQDRAATARASGAPVDHQGLDLRRRTLWLFGNEGQGLAPEEKAMCDACVAVPVYGRAESLNVGTAATVCLYASARAQRPAQQDR